MEQKGGDRHLATTQLQEHRREVMVDMIRNGQVLTCFERPWKWLMNCMKWGETITSKSDLLN
jgi:hypothetical protein